MKKRILSILLCLCMVACMLPTVAFAADTGKAIRLVNTNNPTGGILGYKNNNNSYDYIYMGSYNSSPVKWRVLDDQTNTGATGLFLLSEDLLGSAGHGDVYDVYFDGTSPYSNAWQGSDAQGWCNTFESSNLDSRELAAILSTTKSDEAFTSSTHNVSFAASTNILNSDQVFFLSAQEAENGQYGFTDEAARVANYGAYASVWWLRSPFAKFTSSAGAVDGFGMVCDCGVGGVWAARPAFNLNLNSVLFTSAAVGGKPDGGLTAVPEYSGNEWKLTLLDSSRSFAVMKKAVSATPDGTVTLNYKGATTGINEYISVILADNNGAQYYARVAQPTAESGTVEIKIPSDLAPGSYTLKVFSEQYNGDYNTDYASNFTDIALTVENQPDEQFTLTPGGRYYFDLSAMDIPGTVNTGNIFGATSLPDTTLHYVPFTYAGTVNAYKLTTEMATTEEYAQKNKYPHSLFVADYAVTNDVSWDALNTADLIFGKNYASGGVDYTLRAPSVGSNATGSGASQRIVPQSNEWDTMLNKDSGYIQNWNKMYSWGQDTHSISAPYRAIRGYDSARYWISCNAAGSFPYVGFRPVLEVLNPDTLGSDGMKVVTLDLNGGKLGGSSEDIQIIVKSGESFTAPASDGLTRPDGDTGSYFKWLGSDGNLYAPGDRVPADVTALTVQWTAPTYTVTLNTNGGTINNGNVTGYTYGVGAKLPTADDMTYTGYTFKGWYDNENLTGSPVTAIGGTETGNKEYWAKWEINQYTITFDSNGGSEIAPITQNYGTKITAPADPTRKGYTFKGWDKEIPETMPAENITITARWRDTEKPTGEIIIGTNKWNKFLNELTFGIFFKDTQEVTINAVDNSGTVFVSYLVTDKDLSEAELDSLVFRAYEEPFCIDPNGEYIVYVMLVDENINITYLRSDRLTLDNIHPVIGGIENGKTYCEAQTVTVDEKYVDTVTVNGKAATLDANGGFVLPPTNGEQKIVVTDKAGNTAEMTVTVNDGHTFGEWTSNGDGTHTRKCTADGCTEGIETDNCTDEDKNHICDICGNIISNHEDANQDHVCDLCGKVISNHEDADKDHVCDHCGKVISNHEDANKDHVCDYCGKVFSNHEDADKDHVCDCCGKVITNHIGGKETCRDKAVCEVCGKSYGKLDPKNHTDLKHFPAKAATEDADGNIEYWYCSGCNKYYSDKDGTKEIAKADTVTAKLPVGTVKSGADKSPQTGDNSNLLLWIALLFISGGVLTGVTVFDKRKRHSVK